MIRLADLIPGESSCLRVALDGDQAVNCGLLWQHPGPCVPFVPGDYLPPPMLHPLDMWMHLPRWRCPLCRRRFSYCPGAEAVTAFRGGLESWDRARLEWQWEFRPCGCVGREVFNDEPAADGLVLHEAAAWLAMQRIERERAA